MNKWFRKSARVNSHAGDNVINRSSASQSSCKHILSPTYFSIIDLAVARFKTSVKFSEKTIDIDTVRYLQQIVNTTVDDGMRWQPSWIMNLRILADIFSECISQQYCYSNTDFILNLSRPFERFFLVENCDPPYKFNSID